MHLHLRACIVSVLSMRVEHAGGSQCHCRDGGGGLQRRMASLWRHGSWWSRASPGWHRSRRRKFPPGRRGGSPASPDGSRREAGSRQIGEQTGVHLRTVAAARWGGAGLRRDGAREAPPHQSVDGGRWIREKLKTAPMIYYGAGTCSEIKTNAEPCMRRRGKNRMGRSARRGSGPRVARVWDSLFHTQVVNRPTNKKIYFIKMNSNKIIDDITQINF